MSRESFTTPDGCRLVYDIAGQGPAVLWQHGLGAPFDQPLAVFPDLPVTRITLACRGHEDSDLGPLEDLSIATFARDALALLDHLGIESLAAAGGISLGAGLSLRLAAYHPGRVQRLILARPAWIDRPSMEGQQGYVEAGRHLELHGATEGLALFRASALFQAVEARIPRQCQVPAELLRPSATRDDHGAVGATAQGLAGRTAVDAGRHPPADARHRQR